MLNKIVQDVSTFENLFFIWCYLNLQWAAETQIEGFITHIYILLILLSGTFLLVYLFFITYLSDYFWESLLIFWIFLIFYSTASNLLFNLTLSCIFHEQLNILTYDSGFLCSFLTISVFNFVTSTFICCCLQFFLSREYFLLCLVGGLICVTEFTFFNYI